MISAIALSCHARFPESQTFWKFVENDTLSLYCGNYFKSDVNIFETGSNMQTESMSYLMTSASLNKGVDSKQWA